MAAAVDAVFPRNRRGTSSSSADAAALSSAQPQQVVHIVAPPVGVFGWRKRLLYASVALLLALAIVNAGLLVYLITTLHISGGSAGPLRFDVRRSACFFFPMACLFSLQKKKNNNQPNTQHPHHPTKQNPRPTPCTRVGAWSSTAAL
jgi:hypothetical protein